ncbi:hypothetical protein P5V15_004400 [Pogonomyrmex californicus]
MKDQDLHEYENEKKEKTDKRKRIFLMTKRGGALPILPVLGTLLDRRNGVAKAVNDSKAAQLQFEELQCHNRAMETRGQELYVAPYMYKQRLYFAPHKHER